jgi:hypothetical protein
MAKRSMNSKQERTAKKLAKILHEEICRLEVKNDLEIRRKWTKAVQKPWKTFPTDGDVPRSIRKRRSVQKVIYPRIAGNPPRASTSFGLLSEAHPIRSTKGAWLLVPA